MTALNSAAAARVFSRSGWIAWILCGIAIVFALLTLWFFALSPEVKASFGFSGRLALVFFFIYSIVGALIVSRQPSHLIGWIFCWTGVANEVIGFSKEYAIFSILAQPGQFSGGEIAGWLRSWLWIPGTFFVTVFMPLLFPSGRLPSRRWRPFASIAILSMTAATVAVAMLPGNLIEAPFITNPLGIEGAGEILESIFIVGFNLSGVIGIAGIVSLFQRMRESAGQERKQFQWLMLILIVYGIGFPLSYLDVSLSPYINLGVAQAIPVAVGIAILRYRLYDIDIIIRRTLIYGALTAMLALVYFGSVVLLQLLFRVLTGQQQSEIITILSTLAIAALFTPLRARLQNAIDARFYRTKYDAARIIAQFAQNARDEVELERLTGELVNVVTETMQPTSVSVWLKKTNDRRHTLEGK